jgi:high-affinity iron transporter
VDFGALTAGFLTGLREGVEAALILAIILAYLVRTGNGAQVGKVWLGAGLAVALSLVVGVGIFVTVGSFVEPYEQLWEGVAMLVAAGVVTWMLFWMRRQAGGMRNELQAAVDRAITEGTVLGLAILAFTAVIREGIETALFLSAQATSVESGAISTLVGAVAGIAAAVVIGWIFYTGSRRINLRTFFTWTGVALVFIAAGLLSHAVHEFIEVGEFYGIEVIGSQTAYDISSVLSHENGIGQFLRAIFGYSASPEILTLGVHLTYLVVVLALYLRPIRPAVPPARQVEVPANTEGARS